jgi:hypothetical protein
VVVVVVVVVVDHHDEEVMHNNDNDIEQIVQMVVMGTMVMMMIHDYDIPHLSRCMMMLFCSKQRQSMPTTTTTGIHEHSMGIHLCNEWIVKGSAVMVWIVWITLIRSNDHKSCQS